MKGLFRMLFALFVMAFAVNSSAMSNIQEISAPTGYDCFDALDADITNHTDVLAIDANKAQTTTVEHIEKAGVYGKLFEMDSYNLKNLTLTAYDNDCFVQNNDLVTNYARNTSFELLTKSYEAINKNNKKKRCLFLFSGNNNISYICS